MSVPVIRRYCYVIRIIDKSDRLTRISIIPGDFINIRFEEQLPVKVVAANAWKTGPLHYKMNSYPRGCALIVNNKEFQDGENFPKRNGAENDEKRLKEMLQQFYFDVEFHENKTRMVSDVPGRRTAGPRLQSPVDSGRPGGDSHYRISSLSISSRLILIDPGRAYPLSDTYRVIFSASDSELAAVVSDFLASQRPFQSRCFASL